MLAERCPNCGAYLPVRQAGIAVRTCEFCGLEVPGGAPLIEVPRLTTERPAVRPLDDDPAPPAIPARSRHRGVWIIVGALVVFAIINVIVRSGGGKKSGSKPPPVQEEPAAAPAPPPSESPARIALRQAVDAAGGAQALDPIALLPHVESVIRAGLPPVTAEAPEPVLLLMRCSRLRNGKADLTVTSDSRCSYEYRIPALTVRPADVPDGVSVDVPCQRWFSVDAALDDTAATEHRYDVTECRRRVAVRPPRCTLAEVWERAVAAGLPPNAVASLGFSSRYRSPYDPIDPADDPDRPERGRWTLGVERDGADDVRVELHDTCGHTPTADEQAVAAAFDRARPRLLRCHATGAAGHAAVQAFEQIWRLTVDARGRATVTFSDPGVDIEGMFSGDLDAYRTRFAACAAAVVTTLKLPATLPALRLELRVEKARLVLSPPPYE